MSININDAAQCKAIWINYKYRNNSLKVSADDIKAIEEKYSGKLNNWKLEASKDINQYEITDTVTSDKTGGNTAKAGINAAGTVAVGTFSMLKGGWKEVKGNIGKLFSKGGRSELVESSLTTKTTTKRAAEGLANEQGCEKASASTYVQAAMAIATALLYTLTKPNRNEAEEAMALMNDLQESQDQLIATNEEMQATAEEAQAMADAAETRQNDVNDEIIGDKELFDANMRSYKYLKAKADSGEPLTKEEAANYKRLCCVMNNIGNGINKKGEALTDEIQSVYSDVGEKLETLETGAAQIDEIANFSNEAIDFNSGLKTAATVEMVSQGLNVIQGTTAGIRLLGLGFWNAILAAASFGAAATSGAAVMDQKNIRNQAGMAQDFSEATLDFSDQSAEVHAISDAEWNDAMSVIEQLGPDITDNMKAPDCCIHQTADTTEPQDKTKDKKDKE